MVPRSRPTPRQERVFFAAAALWFVTLTFVGFAPTFYLRTEPEPLPRNLVVHGLVYSAWVLLFAVQVGLVSAHRTRVHEAPGAASTLLLLVMIPVGFNVVLTKAAAGQKSVEAAGFNLASLSLGFGLGFAGLACHKRPFVHKRLMLFATLMLTIAAADRVALNLGAGDVRLFRKLLAVAPGVALVVYDAVRHRRFPVLGAALLAVSWLNVWFIASNLVFLRPVGRSIIAALTRVFVW